VSQLCDSDTIAEVKVRTLERIQIVRRPIVETFRFFSDPHNLQRLTPAFLNFRFLEPPPEVMHPGTAIDYQIRLYGVPVHWRTRIEVVEPPTKFVDVQEKGPYALWRHSHIFKDIGGGATEVRDRVEYAMPLGPLGEIAYHLFVAGSLAQIFEYRERELAAIMGM
jgi:ligand-binding SRPBCC domain-containing protein